MLVDQAHLGYLLDALLDPAGLKGRYITAQGKGGAALGLNGHHVKP